MRLFVSINLPDEWKSLLAGVEQSIGWLAKGVKWTKPETMHLTLKFLGEVDEIAAEKIKQELAAVCKNFEPFEMKIRGTGVFPNSKKPRIFWAGLQTNGTLLELQSAVESAMETVGFPREEHPFRPHLTLARIKEPLRKDRITDALLSYKLESEPFLVHEVHLMRSHLDKDHARHEPIAAFAL